MISLKDGCRWRLKLNGKEVDLGTGSDNELDLALKSRLKNIEFLIKDGTPLSTLFSMSDLDVAKAKIQDVCDELTAHQIKRLKNAADPGEEEVYYEVEGSMGVTRFLTKFGNGANQFVPPFEQEAWRTDRILTYINGGKTHKGNGKEGDSFELAKDKNKRPIKTFKGDGIVTEEEFAGNVSDPARREEIEQAKREATKIVDTEIASWKKLTEIGTAVHLIFEEVLSGKEVTTPDPNLVPKEIFESFKRQALDFKVSLETKYPGCQIYTEMGLKSKFVTKEWETKLGAEGKSSLTGIIDLLVIDKNGVAHLYDYKVSRKSVGKTLDRSARQWWKEESNFILGENEFWHTTKKMSAEYQLAIYADMLRQYGIKVDRTATVVPVKLDLTYEDDGFTVKGVRAGQMYTGSDTIEVDVSISSKRGSQIHGIFREPPTINIESESEISRIHSGLFPANNSMTRMSAQRADREYYKKYRPEVVSKVKFLDPQYKDGARWKFKPVGLPNAKTVWCKTEEELNEHLDSYIASLEENRTDRCLTIAQKIHKIKTEDDYTIDNFIDDVSDEKTRNFLKLQFERYFEGDWEFEPNDDLNSFGIFLFRKDNKIEVVMVTDTALRTNINLGMGTSILGKNTKDLYVDKTRVLPAMSGYMELIRGMLYVGLNPESFDGAQIAEIRVINPTIGDEITVDNDRLIENYEQLRLKNRDLGMPRLKPNIFMSSTKAISWCALDRAEYAGYNMWGILESNTQYWTEQYILAAMDRLKRDANIEDWNGKPKFANTEAWIAYKKLYEAYNTIHGFYTTIEGDVDEILTSRNITDINGLMISSPQYSPSANIRMLGKVIDQYSKEVHREVLAKGQPMALIFRELYDKYGTGAKTFSSWFERNADGSLDSRFILKDPNSPEFNGDPLVRKAITQFLDTLAELKNPGMTEAKLKEYRKSEEYRQVPLLEAKVSRQLKGVGIWQTIKNKFAEVTNLTEGMFAGEGVEKDEVDFGSVASYVDKHGKLYNKFELTDAARDDRINKYGIGMFETDLELVFNAALVTYTKANISQKYIPIITGMRIGLQYADTYGGTDMQNMSNISEYFDKVVKSKFYGESIVKGKHLRNLLKCINVVKSIFSTMTLALNVKSFLRESLQGIWSGSARAMAHLMPGIDEKTYVKALTYTIQESHKNLSGVSMLQQLNMSYGMANQSLSQLAQGRRVNWLSVKHWGKDTMFLTATSPDFMHRMSILVAKMMGDNCWEAHSVDEEGNLHYDWTKDHRFDVFRSGDVNHKDYMKQKAMYQTYIDAFNQEGFRNADGSELNAEKMDALPQAYTMQEGQGIKNYADLLYGHYDDESRSILCDTFAGAIFLQYKTFITAKLEQWLMKGGVYSTETMQEQFDSVTGERIYQRFYEDSDNFPHREFLLESEYNNLSEEEKATCRPYYEFTGVPMEGMFKSSMSLLLGLLPWTDEKVKEVWNDPTKRCMLKLMLQDQFLAMLAGFLIMFVFGQALDSDNPMEVYKEVKKAGPAVQFAYNVLTGSVQDSQFHNIISSFAADPPSVTALQRFCTSSWDLITGDHNLVYWATRNFGAVREFQGLAKLLDE